MTKKLVLLVDDEVEILAGAKLWFTAAGFDTKYACNGSAAIVAACETQPDAIVMDVRMPEMDGLTALAELKGRAETRDIPVVMLSASLVDKERAFDIGARFFLTKPYHGRNLVNVVEAAIRQIESDGVPIRLKADRHGAQQLALQA